MIALVERARRIRWIAVAVVLLRFLIGYAFLPAALKKVLGKPFTDPTNTGPFHDFLHGFYGYEATNAGTLFAKGVSVPGGGRTVDRSGPAVLRLVERLGAPPAFRNPTAPETLPLLADHALQDWRDVVRR